jgi:threonyl-tRNA synthetase
LYSVYRDFGFHDVILKLSTRPEKRVGSDESWDKAEKALSDALICQEKRFELCPGEGAFYGPKIEFSLKDSLGRVWQCGTIQVDFQMPERLGATYVGEDGARHTPVMLHRAILGSLQRFMGILIEECAGHLPLWLAPIQVVVMNITSDQADYCEKITKKLKTIGLSVISDLRNEKIGFKIREHSLRHIPYLLVIGNKEMAAETIAVRTQQGEDLGAMALEHFIERLKKEIDEKQGIKINEMEK